MISLCLSSVLRFGDVLALCMEAVVRVCCVVDDVELALLVVVSVPPMHHPGRVSLLISELSVVPARTVLCLKCYVAKLHICLLSNVNINTWL